MTLPDYFTYLGWTTVDLARYAGINQATARKAYYGQTVTARVARQIATAISTALGRQVNVGDIIGLNFS